MKSETLMDHHSKRLPYLTKDQISAELELGNYDDAADLAGDCGWLYPGHEIIPGVIENLTDAKEDCVKKRRYKPVFTLSQAIRKLENHGLTPEGYVSKEALIERSLQLYGEDLAFQEKLKTILSGEVDEL